MKSIDGNRMKPHMHPTQEKLLRLAGSKDDLGSMSYREIGKLVDETSAQKVKHHLLQLQKKGLIDMNKERGLLKKAARGQIQNTDLIAVPILGSANCGPAEMIADSQIEGYIRVSKKMLHGARRVFAIRAVGNSMNKAKIDGKGIENGDLVIIDSAVKAPKNGDYVVSIIDGAANIKRFFEDKANKQIALVAMSTEDYPTIYIQKEDSESYLVNGKVVQVIKNARMQHRED